jgi:phosphatidylglycerol:prolipoprotein diacylglycerol transferase
VAIWDGGLAIYGAVIAAIITVAVYCKVRKQSFWCYADIGCYGLLIGQLVGRWGNFVNVECYGSLTTLPWRMCSETIANELWYKGLLESSDVYQSILDGTVGVHPTFLYESLWNLLGFVILVLIGRKGRKFDGQIFLSYIVWYGLGRAAIEGLRTDSLYFFGTGIRSSQMLGLFSALAAVALMAIRRKTAGPATPPTVPASVKAGEKAEEGAEPPKTEQDDTDDT